MPTCFFSLKSGTERIKTLSPGISGMFFSRFPAVKSEVKSSFKVRVFLLSEANLTISVEDKSAFGSKPPAKFIKSNKLSS